MDLKNASPGVFFSKNGKFAEQGGVLDIDFFNCTSIAISIKDKLITCNWGKKPNQKGITHKIIRENMNNRGECFIPWSRGGCIAGNEETGTLINSVDTSMHAGVLKLEQRIHRKKSRSS